MTPMNGGMGNISSFANKVNNCVAAIRTLNKLSYLTLRTATSPNLMFVNFLNKIADQCSASMPIEKGGSRNLRPTGTTPAKNKHDQHYEKSPVRYVEADIIGYSTKSGPRERVMRSAQTTVVTEHTAVSVNNVNTMRAYLKIVPVELYGPEGSMKVHALLDEGSTVTLIDEQVANRIGRKDAAKRYASRVSVAMR
ncbi:hypothetical protein EVAR_75575_1 [Eumeta japonica]|uniref:Uncharacterized protein n=1 Tax=Eumeta variegata TaxID=151549 RepID=A0A4C1UIZ1_EUMVA|nr:hypothetical protein EVAR_75575_1 [Eumeta japonica]